VIILITRYYGVVVGTVIMICAVPLTETLLEPILVNSAMVFGLPVTDEIK
jgi:hypothetical protein